MLALVLVWKLRRVGRRIVQPALWDRSTRVSLATLGCVGLALLSGWVWSSLGPIYIAGYSLLVWHGVLGLLLTVGVIVHLAARAKLPRARDVAGRRQLLATAAVGLGGFIAWRVQRPLAALLNLPAEKRRFTGSYEADSFAGNEFPVTSWVADDPAPLDDSYTLRVDGLVRRPLELRAPDLDGEEEVTATLDCTCGFYSRQRWGGTRVMSLIDRAGPLREARFVRVISHTGYRWSFDLADARGLMLATSVSGEPLSHEHGAPVRLVAPGRRGFEWVKWVVRLELHSEPDYGALASTIWSSFTPAGRGSS
jgi:hypothetical protein